MARYEKTWQFDSNRAVTASTVTDMAKYTLWYYKAFLCGQIGGAVAGLWTVMGSSDGVAGAMDGQDRWTSTFNAAKLVRNQGANPHSWVVLKSPPIKNLFQYMLITWSSSVDYQFTLSITATLPTGGSNIANPTLTNPATLANQAFCPSSNSGNFHLNAALATDGSFYMLQSRDNTSKFVSGFVGSYLGNAKPSDAYPFWYSLNSDPGLTSGYGLTSVNTGIEYPFNGLAIPPDNSVQVAWTWAAIIPAATNIPIGSDPFDSSYLDYPIFIGSSTTAIRGVRGRLQDIAYFPGGANTGTVDSTPGAPSYMVVGNYWFPTNAAPQL